MKNDKKVYEKILVQIEKNVDSKNLECVIEGCSNIAINSHILQKNGILNSISTANHFHEYKNADIFDFAKSNSGKELRFRKTGVNKAHSYRTLCSEHDTNLFKSIEKHPIDFDDYNVHLLFAYRTVLSLTRKEQIVQEKILRKIASKRLNEPHPALQSMRKDNDQILKEINKALEERGSEIKRLESNLSLERKDYAFIKLNYPLKKVYSSSRQKTPKTGETFYVNIFPYNNASNVLIFYPKEYKDSWFDDYLESWTGLTEKEFERRLTTHLFLNCENWGIAKEHLENVSQKELDKTILISQKLRYNFNVRADLSYSIGFNLFSKDR
ncbi:hypothetical protein [Maribacter halichondriae]|uniref:hypothetical protein n=1 Tax=Maribacter halichondriae TaxID=2980554 RepID=UPI002359B96B|nr:hypothetical protein [Maribacter sp. Hal144]